ncbi:MAG TPA: GyrI-like domain-containing protein [Anaerolineales bacterium]|nr:GyrI-like domain-containing protein [Anaerolineales bacterium]
MAKDFRKEIGAFYSARRDPALVRLPAIKYLMILGRGHPAKGTEYREAIQALYTLVYTLKFSGKKGTRQREMPVLPLDSLWWQAGRKGFDSRAPGSAWRWQAMLAVPGFVTQAMLDKVRKEAMAKKPLPALRKVRLKTWKEGLSAQVLHIGPYAAEPPTIKRLHEFIKEQGHRPRGRHHEIYLSDPSRTSPKKLKTILRQPVS